LKAICPERVIGLIIEWAEIHKQELMDDWESIKNDGTFKKINPLI
jgi:hypothetical protein